MWRAGGITGWRIAVALGILTPMSGIGTRVGVGQTSVVRNRTAGGRIAGMRRPTRSSCR